MDNLENIKEIYKFLEILLSDANIEKKCLLHFVTLKS